MASYNQWSDWCRQTLLWLGMPDPAQSLFNAASRNPDRDLMVRLLPCWHECFGIAPTMVRDLTGFVYDLKENEDKVENLKHILEDIAGGKVEINNRKLGRWIKRHENQIVNGMRLIPDTAKRTASAWRIELVI